MPKSRKRLARPAPTGGEPAPGYPSVREHLVNRRDMLTFVGATLMGGVLSSCYATMGAGAIPNYHTFRLPEEGTLQTQLASGELCEFYVNGSRDDDSDLIYDVAEEACLEVLGDTLASELSTDSGYRAVEQALFIALGQHISDLGHVALTVLTP